MAKAKPQKSKPKKQPHQVKAKKQAKDGDLTQFRAQLDALGLKIIQVTSDGNCFFRAIADQLEGNEDEHSKYRSMVVQYIVKNREMFEPFIEDDVPFMKNETVCGKEDLFEDNQSEDERDPMESDESCSSQNSICLHFWDLRCSSISPPNLLPSL